MPWLHQIDPVAIELGPVAIHWYGIMYLIAFATAWWLGVRRLPDLARRLGVDEARAREALGDLVFYVMVGIIAGGRLGYLLVYDFQAWIADPLVLLKVWQGGMSFHGGLVGVLIAGWWWARKYRIGYWDTIDYVAPLVPPGLGFGRLGNFIGGELWGKPTDASYGVIFPGNLPESYASLPADALATAWRAGELNAYAHHPSQLYQAVLEGLVLFALLWWFSSRPRPRYAVAGLFALAYGVFRFAVEFVRMPDAHLGYLAFGWVTMGQVLSLPLIVVGIALLVLSRRAPVAGARA
jgi:phosphatidylglycerol:prolipoprotein diacylglycerol transferase